MFPLGFLKYSTTVFTNLPGYSQRRGPF